MSEELKPCPLRGDFYVICFHTLKRKFKTISTKEIIT